MTNRRPRRTGPRVLASLTMVAVAALDDLRSIASQPGQALTFTCAPWGSGERMGVDRDLDGIPDGEDTITE